MSRLITHWLKVVFFGTGSPLSTSLTPVTREVIIIIILQCGAEIVLALHYSPYPAVPVGQGGLQPEGII